MIERDIKENRKPLNLTIECYDMCLSEEREHKWALCCAYHTGSKKNIMLYIHIIPKKT